MTASGPLSVMFAAMVASVKSAAVLGVQAFEVTVEVDVTRGLPQWSIVGLAASSVKESRERVTSALANAGINLPARRVTVNLAPGDDSAPLNHQHHAIARLDVNLLAHGLARAADRVSQEAQAAR